MDSIQSHAAVKIGLVQSRASKCQVQDERRRYLAEGYVERSAVDSKGERFLYWYKATGQPQPKEPVKMIGPKSVDNEVIL